MSVISECKRPQPTSLGSAQAFQASISVSKERRTCWLAPSVQLGWSWVTITPQEIPGLGNTSPRSWLGKKAGSMPAFPVWPRFFSTVWLCCLLFKGLSLWKDDLTRACWDKGLLPHPVLGNMRLFQGFCPQLCKSILWTKAQPEKGTFPCMHSLKNSHICSDMKNSEAARAVPHSAEFQKCLRLTKVSRLNKRR